jgi:hypothetical protein
MNQIRSVSESSTRLYEKPYRCIRCGYRTHCLNKIIHHFYQRITECFPIERDIHLTEEMKSEIIKNKFYSDKTILIK